MNRFCDRLTRCPIPYEADRAAEIVETYPELSNEMRDLVAGTGGSSPFLRGLLRRERDWAAKAMNGTPEAARDEVFENVATLEYSRLKPGLREAKRRVALLVALADLGGVWSLEEVTATLSGFADLATNTALDRIVRQERGRGKVPAPSREAPAAGMTVIAMGKLGALELNYSSDIDLICLFDDTLFPADIYLEARTGFVRATRAMSQVLSDVTEDGYVFRTDLRLRPDASVTPVCLPIEAAENYYESMGRTWERAAYIKARACAGDIASGEAFLRRLTPFVWRRNLDYAAIQDAHAMRLKIREHKGLSGRSDLPSYNIKLGPGGIREIEFFAQTLQLIAGGREPALRSRGTIEALARLVEGGWVDADTATVLTQAYRDHRELEHRLQMIDDQQTQILPRDDAGFDRLAAMMGTSADTLKTEIADRLARVAGLTEDFFAPSEPTRTAPALSDSAREIVAKWPGYPAMRSKRAVEIFDRVRPELLARLERASNPDEALRRIDGFLAGLPAGVQLFSLFDANPGLLDLIVDIADVSPELAEYLSRNASVLDAVIGGSFFEDWPGRAALFDDLKGRLAAIGDYERQLDAARIWKREWHFRVGVHLLRGLIDADKAGEEYADVAEVVVAALVEPVLKAFAEKHGRAPGRGIAFLGMGSLGSGRLTATSDLDLIAIYDAGTHEASRGPKPLPVRTYFARLTQSFVTALTAPMAEGRLYEVDMRLRPSGRQGPVATSLAGFRDYQLTEAWTWEHLALTRARIVAGNRDLGRDVEAVRAEVLVAPNDIQTVRAEVAEMRERLFSAKPQQGLLDPKFGPGRMQDIELAAQTAALLSGSTNRLVADQLEVGAADLGLSPDEAILLSNTHALLWRVQSAARLIGAASGETAALGEGARRFLCKTTGVQTTVELEARLVEQVAKVGEILDRCLGRTLPDG